eukprot:gene5071-6311_t
MNPSEIVVYEVTATIKKDKSLDWKPWIIKHVKEIISLENGALFHKGMINKLDDEPGSNDGTTETYVMVYFAKSRKCLETYLEKHTAALRQDAINTFGDSLKTSRRIYTPVTEPIQYSN